MWAGEAGEAGQRRAEGGGQGAGAAEVARRCGGGGALTGGREQEVRVASGHRPCDASGPCGGKVATSPRDPPGGKG